MSTYDTLPYVIAAYSIAWTVLIGYAAYLWKLGKGIEAEARSWE